MAKQAHTEERTALVGHHLAGAWAIESNFPVRAVLHQVAIGKPPKNWKAEPQAALKFPAYANPDGGTVSTLDSAVDSMIQEGAIAIIPIAGMMMREAREYEAFYGTCSTERLTQAIERATTDSRVKAIVLTSFSPGGQVAGCERYAKAVAAAKASKKVIGHIERSYSGSYWGMANCTEVYLDGATAQVGSIGIMQVLEDDTEEWLQRIGTNRKEVVADGSDEKNLAVNEALEGKFQRLKDEELNPLREAFVAAVQEGRGAKLKSTKANDPLKGRTYTGQDAIDVGLADGFATLAQCIEKARAADGDTPTNANNPNAMSKFTNAAKAVKEFFAFKEKNTEPNAEQLAEANAALKGEGLEGMQLVSATAAKTLGEVEALRKTATDAVAAKDAAETRATQAEARATALEGTLNAAVVERKITVKEGETSAQAIVGNLAAIEQEIQAGIKENALEVKDGKTAVQTVVETLNKWGKSDAAAHAGKGRKEDKKLDPAEEYPSLAAAKKAGINLGEAK